jgi:DNA-binding transcriptional ArsR family regulator
MARASAGYRATRASSSGWLEPLITSSAPTPRSRGLHPAVDGRKVNHMVQYPEGRLDLSFAALSDATRRGVLERLGRGDASITELAGSFRMTLTGMRKHVGVLEQAGLVSTQKVGRVRTCRLGPRRLGDEIAWIEQQRRMWDARFDQLEQVVAERRRKEHVDGHPNRG